MSAPSKPRVHWVSPLPMAQTDIAHYTGRILPELAAETDLTLWTDAEEWDPALQNHCPVRRIDPDHALPRDLVAAGREGDVVFVHIGNSWVFHSGFLRLVQRLPSIIVLHDLAIQELCYDALSRDRLDPDIYRRAMTRWYGEQGTQLVDDLLRQNITAQDLAPLAPGFEITLNRAIAVLTHTPAAYDAVTARQWVPAHLMDLPFAPSATRPPATRPPEGPLRLVQFGYIGPNRRLETVLEALSEVRGDIDFQFDIMGRVWDPAYIEDRITVLDLGDRVKQHGFVDEAELDARLASAHLAFNLRYPTMGEASGSQLRIWNASAAAVVTDQGYYAGLPDDTVFKIPPEGEQAALMELLRRFAADRSIGADKGDAGRALLEARHTPARYAKGIAEIARQGQADARNALFARSARRVLGRSADPHPLLQARLARQF